MSKPAIDLFISYAREDRAKASRLADSLAGRGWTVWWDPLIRGGEQFDRSIEQALRNARCAVVLWSRHSVDSDWVRSEAGYAKDHGKLIPALLEAGIELPLQFRLMHVVSIDAWGDGQQDDAAGLAALFRDIETFLGESARGAAAPVRVAAIAPATEAQPSAPAKPAARPAAAMPAPGHAAAPRSRTALRFSLALAAVLAAAFAAQCVSVSGLYGAAFGGADRLAASLWLGLLPGATCVLVCAVAWASHAGTRHAWLAALLVLGALAAGASALWPGPAAVFGTTRAVSGASAMAVLMLALHGVSENGAEVRLGMRIGALVAAPPLAYAASGWFVARAEVAAVVTLVAAGACVAGAVVAIVSARRAGADAGDAAAATGGTVPSPRRGVGAMSWRVAVAALIVATLCYGVPSSFPRHLIEVQGAPVAMVQQAHAFAGLAAMPAALLAGHLVDRLGPWRPAVAALVAMVLCAWVAFHTSVGLGIAAFALLFAALAAWSTILYLLAARQAVAAASSWPLAMLIVAISLGQMLSGAFAGVLVESLGSGMAMPWLVTLSLVALPVVRAAMRDPPGPRPGD